MLVSFRRILRESPAAPRPGPALWPRDLCGISFDRIIQFHWKSDSIRSKMRSSLLEITDMTQRIGNCEFSAD